MRFSSLRPGWVARRGPKRGRAEFCDAWYGKGLLVYLGRSLGVGREVKGRGGMNGMD